MCCRYFLLQDHLREVLAAFGLPFDAATLPASRYNLAPGTRIPVIRTAPKTKRAESALLHWGLVPAWAKSDSGAARLANARAETLAAKPSFRDAFRSRRCLIPASGFYEWEHRGRHRLPWLFRRPDQLPCYLAGLWEIWHAPDGRTLESCAIVTTAPNTLMAPIHHRMPALLTEDNCAAWLDPQSAEPATLLRPAPDTALTAQRVSPHVNNVRHDDPACLAPATQATSLDDSQFSFAL